MLIHKIDMAIWMSNFDNFDIDQISSNVAQRKYLVCNLYHIKIFILNCLDNTKNANENIFIITQYLPLFPWTRTKVAVFS